MAASGLWVVLVSFLSRRSHVRMAKKMVNNPENANLLDYREMTFLDDSIESKNARSNTRMSWETIVKLADTSTHFLLYTGANQAIIIPKEKITAKDVEALQSLFKAHNLL